jgi:IclR family acetate operon transcriptional repressor
MGQRASLTETGRGPVAAPSRSLSTARAVLRVFTLLLESPAGVRADEVAEALGKSVSTAYYLLTSLCEEGFAVHECKGVYRATRGLEELTAAVGEHGDGDRELREGLAATVDELFLRTRKRSYLGVVRAGKVEIVAFCGRQGVPRMPGLGSEIRDSAHALAMGKVVLARLGPPELGRYIQRGLRRFTPHTITSEPEFVAELASARRNGYATDREEFDENFCCIAAPIVSADGRFVAALGMSMSVSVFDREREGLAATVVAVARSATVGRRLVAVGADLQGDAKTGGLLVSRAGRPYVGSGRGRRGSVAAATGKPTSRSDG